MPCPPRAAIMRNSHPHTDADDHGAIAIEFVLVVPFLIALIFAIAQFGIFFSMKVETESTARDAARTLALGGPAAVVATPAGWTATAVAKCAAELG